MHQVTATTPRGAYAAALELILDHGVPVDPRSAWTTEVLNATIRIEHPWVLPLRIPARAFSDKIMAVELLQLVGQTTSPEAMRAASKNLMEYADHGVFHGAYGVRAHGQLGPLVEELQHDRASRRAVLSIYDSTRDLGRSSKDIPCTVSLQFFIRDSELLLRSSMRSNDAWLGLGYDLVQFAALQGAVAAAIGVPMGPLVHTVGSLHLYQGDIEKAFNVLSSEGPVEPPDWGYETLWHDRTISLVSHTARKILFGQHDHALTEFELWLAKAVAS